MFKWADGSGWLPFAAVRDLSYKTDGVAMEYADWVLVAEAVGFDPAVGMRLDGLRVRKAQF